MCSIFGALLIGMNTIDRRTHANEILDHMYGASHERGRDGRGYHLLTPSEPVPVHKRDTRRGDPFDLALQFYPIRSNRTLEADPQAVSKPYCLIGNTRAEPTTEFVENKREQDQQPYALGNWAIVHNGTIANDKGMRTYDVDTNIDSAAVVEQLDVRSSVSNQPAFITCPRYYDFVDTIRTLKGSFAILASNSETPGTIYFACNYRPIWYARTAFGVFFASTRQCFPPHLAPQMIPPYTMGTFDVGNSYEFPMHIEPLVVQPWGDGVPAKALVVCSGGLDSVVAATEMVRRGHPTTLVHFRYGSRAEGPEVVAVQAAAKALGVPVVIKALPVYDPSDSPLLQADAAVAGGEEGAEFAHEWVPARNLLLLSVATAMAEAGGYELLVLGNNLEEAGAYPDNEPEFIARFNDLLPFAVGDGKRLRVVMPVGNLMKHEIVAKGLALGAPLDKTWSCYRAGEMHCGTCGPCYMRRKAFAINKADEVIQYAQPFDAAEATATSEGAQGAKESGSLQP